MSKPFFGVFIMSMTKQQIEFAIRDRMQFRWARRLKESYAAPIVALGLVQLDGPDYARTVVCTVEEMALSDLALFLEGAAAACRREAAAQGVAGPGRRT